MVRGGCHIFRIYVEGYFVRLSTLKQSSPPSVVLHDRRIEGAPWTAADITTARIATLIRASSVRFTFRTGYAAHCLQNPIFGLGAEYGSGLSSMHYSDLPGGHGQVVNSIGAPPIAHPSETFLGPSLGTPLHINNYMDGYSSHSHQQSPVAIPPQELSCDDDSQSSAMVSSNVLRDPREDQDAGTYPPSSGQRDTEVTLH